MGAKRPDIDWNAVQALYRADQISTREIARRYGISNVAILARAKREKWAKDLSQRVATGVREAVISASLPKGSSGAKQRSAKDREARQMEVVKAAIEQGKEVVLRHQRLGNLMAENSQTIGEIIRDEIASVRAQLAEGPDPDLKPAEAIRVEESLTKRLSFLARAHDSLARAAVNSVQIERQARGLDDMPADPNAPPSISITYYRQDLVLNKVEGSK